MALKYGTRIMNAPHAQEICTGIANWTIVTCQRERRANYEERNRQQNLNDSEAKAGRQDLLWMLRVFGD